MKASHPLRAVLLCVKDPVPPFVDSGSKADEPIELDDAIADERIAMEGTRRDVLVEQTKRARRQSAQLTNSRSPYPSRLKCQCERIALNLGFIGRVG